MFKNSLGELHFRLITAALDVQNTSEVTCGKNAKETDIAGNSHVACTVTCLQNLPDNSQSQFSNSKKDVVSQICLRIRESCFGLCWFKVLPFS